jgi:hypothetical protein
LKSTLSYLPAPGQAGEALQWSRPLLLFTYILVPYKRGIIRGKEMSEVSGYKYHYSF